ncbi:MAG TPA: hypothetical protein VHP13_11875 [Gammaproteobacteria bacterium]|jgi:hypothetical protein|nr:hypothetical protein [Gammaproteobacteria bacterium]
MRTSGWWVFAGLVLLGFVSGPAQADVSWTGPGWYVESTETGFDSSLVSGPYADKGQCESARPADTDDYSYDCEYESTDPDAATPPRI